MSDANRFTNILKTAQENADRPAEDTTAVATAQPPAKAQRPAPRMSQHVGRPLTGKRSNPDYESTTVFLRRDSKLAAARILLDDKENDLSEVLESLLAGWIRKNSKA